MNIGLVISFIFVFIGFCGSVISFISFVSKKNYFVDYSLQTKIIFAIILGVGLLAAVIITIPADVPRNPQQKIILHQSLKDTPNTTASQLSGSSFQYPSQGVKIKHNIIFGTINIGLNKFDLAHTAAYISIGEDIGSDRENIIVPNVKIAQNNPAYLPLHGHKYGIYLDAISYGYPTDPTTPAAVIQVIELN